MASSADRRIRRAAVLGSPIGHSLSPVLHRAAYAALGLLGWRYDAVECDEAGVGPFVAGLDTSWVGLSVTMPGKRSAAQSADARTARVAALGVANTLVRGHDGWLAENTDVDGIIGALRAAGLPAPQSVLVLGGGGTALAVVAALAEIAHTAGGGAPTLTLAGRRPESVVRAAEVAADLGVGVRTVGFDAPQVRDAAGAADLVVSTVPAGAADHLAVELAAVPALFDVVYHPWPTPLAAAGAGTRRTVTGLDLLLHQAFRQVELFTGQAAPAAAMREALRAATRTDLPLPL